MEMGIFKGINYSTKVGGESKRHVLVVAGKVKWKWWLAVREMCTLEAWGDQETQRYSELWRG